MPAKLSSTTPIADALEGDPDALHDVQTFCDHHKIVTVGDLAGLHATRDLARMAENHECFLLFSPEAVVNLLLVLLDDAGLLQQAA